MVDVPCLSICRLRLALRVSYCQWAVLTKILSAGGTESMMLSACAESMRVSVLPTASMISQRHLIVLLH
jgi:hypothetical protein